MSGNPAHETIIAALGAVLIAAPERERQRLAEAIEHYAARFPIAYREMNPAQVLRELVREVTEAVHARTE